MWREKKDSMVKKIDQEAVLSQFFHENHGGSKRMFNHMLYIQLTMVYKVKNAMLFILLLKTVHSEIKRFQKIHRHFCKTILCVQVPLLIQAHSTRGKTAGTSVFAASLDIITPSDHTSTLAPTYPFTSTIRYFSEMASLENHFKEGHFDHFHSSLEKRTYCIYLRLPRKLGPL